MPRLVDQPPALDLAHLVDRVGELEPAVLGVHGGLGVGQIAAVDVDDAGHVLASLMLEHLSLAN